MADDVARRALIETGSEDAVTVNQRALIDKVRRRAEPQATFQPMLISEFAPLMLRSWRDMQLSSQSCESD